MPTYSPDHDALEFAKRLKEAMADCGINVSRGAGAWLARRFDISKYSGNAWINGTHKPTPERAQELADLCSVQFEWLYFGRGPKRARGVAETPRDYPTQSIELTPEELNLLRHYRAADEPLRNMIDAVLLPSNRPKGKK